MVSPQLPRALGRLSDARYFRNHTTLGGRIVVSALMTSIARFFGWWSSELAGLIPTRLRQAARRVRRCLILRLTETEIQICCRRGAERSDLGTLSLRSEDEAALRSSFQQAVRSVPLRSTEIVMELPPAQILRRRIELPLAALENLREVVGFEIDRYTPFRADEVAYDARVASVDSQAQRARVELLVAPRSLLEGAMDLATRLGLVPDRISVAEGAAEGPMPINLLPPVDSSAKSGLMAKLSVGLAAIALGLVAIAAWLPLERKHQELAFYEERLGKARAAAAEATALRDRMMQSLARSRFLVERRKATPLVVSLLKEATDRLNDQTWVVKLHLAGQEVTLSGYSTAASPLIANLEESDLFEAVRFGSPVTTDSRIGRERFNLIAKVTPTHGE
jgi:general secretion pathway protein L